MWISVLALFSATPVRPRDNELLPNVEPRCRSQPQIEFTDELVVVELFGGAAFEGDLAVDDDIAAVGYTDRLVEVLLGHQDGQLVAVLQFLDLFDRALDEDRREADRGLVDQQDAWR